MKLRIAKKICRVQTLRTTWYAHLFMNLPHHRYQTAVRAVRVALKHGVVGYVAEISA